MPEKDTPLPKHTKLDYYECYAKIALSHLLEKNYESIIIKDKPDLQFLDKSRGIEVTQAIAPEQKKAENLYADISYGKVRNKEKAMQEILRSGFKNEDGILIGKLGIDSFELIMKAVQRKLEKINKGGYAYFDHYDLFVFSDIYADDTMLNNAFQSMLTLSKKYKLSFEKIFILVPGSLYDFELLSKQFHIIGCPNELQCKMACQARAMVEEAENQSNSCVPLE